MERKRAPNPIGVFEKETCFQASYVTPSGDVATKLFCEAYPLLTVPSVGVYGSEYEPCQPIVFLELRSTAAFCKHIMDHFCGVPAGFSSYIFTSSTELECKAGVLVHSFPALGPCQHFSCESMRCVSVMHHPWAFEGEDAFTFTGVTKVFVGIYGAHGVSKVHNDIKDVEDRGMPFGFMGVRSVIIHDASFSPCNCQFYLDESVSHGCSFFTVSWCPEKNRLAVMLHIVPGSPDQEQNLRDELRKSPLDMCVGDLLGTMDSAFKTNRYSELISKMVLIQESM